MKMILFILFLFIAHIADEQINSKIYKYCGSNYNDFWQRFLVRPCGITVIVIACIFFF